MDKQEDTILFLNRVLNGDMSKPQGKELLGDEDSPLEIVAKEMCYKVIEVNYFLMQLAAGNLSFRAPRNNALLNGAKELQAAVKHLMLTMESVAKGEFRGEIEFEGDFSHWFRLFTDQIKLREKEE